MDIKINGGDRGKKGNHSFRFVAQYLLDGVCWILAIIFAITLRFDFSPEAAVWGPVVIFTVIAVLLQACAGWLFALYRGRYVYGTFYEIRALLFSVGGVAVLLFLIGFSLNKAFEFPRSTALIALPFAFSLMGAVRYIRRALNERRLSLEASGTRILVYGAGKLGDIVVRRMLTDPDSPYLPVGIIDDDCSKRRLRLSNIPVLGSGAELAEIARQTSASSLVFCVARADADFIRTVSEAADKAGLRMLILPPLSEIADHNLGLADVRDVAIEDIIGRHPVDTEIESIAHYVTGKRVLVTGAGGSIGSELCRQIARFSPEELLMLDRDETGLHGTQMSLFGHGLLDTRDVILADIREKDVLAAIFAERAPHVVFHAAALKHLPMLEQYPREAWKTNVLGTLNVIEACRGAAVETLINISTDKAADPTSFLGRSKRLAEQVTAWAAKESGMRYLSVRFGNVIGSRGSMFPTFLAQIDAGGPLTVTHPDVTRYFMTIPEACQLVVQAGAIGRSGEVLILDMGEPVRILDVAERMIAMSGKEIEIVFTGLRDGEKLHEALVDAGESDERPFHPNISHSSVPTLAPSQLAAAGDAFYPKSKQALLS
jgi:dTDP-glucose 4,6-dehydratase